MALLLPFSGTLPHVASSAFVAPNATLIGHVTIDAEASVWFGSVLRGDVGRIHIGERSNIQDLCCLHMTEGISHVEVGRNVTIGHSVVLHGCTVEDDCLIGMGSVILDNARIGRGSVVGAGSLVTAGVVVPEGHLVMGRPAKVVRPLRADEQTRTFENAHHYVTLAASYLL